VAAVHVLGHGGVVGLELGQQRVAPPGLDLRRWALHETVQAEQAAQRGEYGVLERTPGASSPGRCARAIPCSIIEAL
jgi:hypothetical protein